MDKPLSHPNVIRFPFYYGWIIVIVGFITLGVAFGVWYSFSVFLLSIIKEFNWSRAEGLSVFSVFLVSQSLMGPLTGHLQDRLGARIVIPVGAVILSLALYFTSLTQNLWQLIVTYGVFA